MDGMTEMQRWLKEQGVSLSDCPYMPGYEMFCFSSLRDFRQEAIAKFSFAILTRPTIEALRPHGPFLEVGAGTGYWAYEMRKAGLDVVAVDPAPYSGVRTVPAAPWSEVLPLTAEEAIDRFPGRTLLTVWPSLNGEWIADALLAFQAAGGRKLVYVGEGEGGCTACDRFFRLLEEGWVSVADLWINQWCGIHDTGTVYVRTGDDK